jgi:hypothetical protein
MLRKIVCAAALLLVVCGAVLAEELKGIINKIEKDKVTFTEGKKGAEARMYDLDPNVKVFRFAKKNEKEAEPDGLKAEPLPNLPKGGVLAVVNVVDGKVTEITIPPRKKK